MSIETLHPDELSEQPRYDSAENLGDLGNEFLRVRREYTEVQAQQHQLRIKEQELMGRLFSITAQMDRTGYDKTTLHRIMYLETPPGAPINGYDHTQ